MFAASSRGTSGAPSKGMQHSSLVRPFVFLAAMFGASAPSIAHACSRAPETCWPHPRILFGRSQLPAVRELPVPNADPAWVTVRIQRAGVDVPFRIEGAEDEARLVFDTSLLPGDHVVTSRTCNGPEETAGFAVVAPPPVPDVVGSLLVDKRVLPAEPAGESSCGPYPARPDTVVADVSFLASTELARWGTAASIQAIGTWDDGSTHVTRTDVLATSTRGQPLDTVFLRCTPTEPATRSYRYVVDVRVDGVTRRSDVLEFELSCPEMLAAAGIDPSASSGSCAVGGRTVHVTGVALGGVAVVAAAALRRRAQRRPR